VEGSAVEVTAMQMGLERDFGKVPLGLLTIFLESFGIS
jgi:hypothetical protein